MISIVEMKTLAEKEREVEKQAKKIKYEKDLARYRDRLKEAKPKLMDYIQTCIYNGLKYNSSIGLYKNSVDKIFKPINKYGTNILYYLAYPENETQDAYEVALKELAKEVREELFAAGVKKIIKSNVLDYSAYIYLEV